MMTMFDYTKMYVCPYCGAVAQLKSYMIKLKSGYNKTHVKCDSCNEKMRKPTLLADMTSYEWGLWLYLNTRIYSSPSYKFYYKIHFDELFENLKNMGIQRDFWDGWNNGKERFNVDGAETLMLLNYKYKIEFKKERKKTLVDYK